MAAPKVDYTAQTLTAAAAVSVEASKNAAADAKASGAAPPASAASATAASSGGTAATSIAASDHIMLVGDSVLDNFIWLKHPKTHNLTEQLRGLAADPNTIHNFAVDESTTADVVRGRRPGVQYVQGRQHFGLEPYPTDKSDGKTHPLRLVTETVKGFASASAGASGGAASGAAAATPAPRGIAVISAGGNDARVCLQHFVSGGSGGGKAVLKAMETPGKHTHNGFTANLTDILRDFTRATPYVVYVLCYLPYKSFGEAFRPQLAALGKHVNDTVILPLARAHRLPVIDLSRTFDPTNPLHYGQGTGQSPIEPSDLSTGFIARLIATVARDFRFGVDDSKVFFGADTIIVEDNTTAPAKLPPDPKPAADATASAPATAAVATAAL